MIATLDWKTARIETERVIQESSKTFYFATRLLPENKRVAIIALYAFCRATDDLIDHSQATLSDLEAWRLKVNRKVEEQTDPILLLWSRVREEFSVERRYEQELIDGVAMDLTRFGYQTWEELQQYCYHVASTVGLMSIPIIGLAKGATFEQAAPFAIQLGVALQLTNILRDIGEDARRGRVYIPEEDLAHFHFTRQDILRGVYDERFVNLMKFEIARARKLYESSFPGIAFLNRSVRVAVGVAALLYKAILDEIEGIGYQVFDHRAFTTSWKKIALLPGILFKVATLSPANSGEHDD